MMRITMDVKRCMLEMLMQVEKNIKEEKAAAGA